jgi:hypothetical protein
MTENILLFIALTAFAVLGLALYRNNVVMKFAVLTVYAVLTSSVYFALDGVKGWPAKEQQEVKGILATVVIINPSDKGEGGIIISLFLTEPAKWHEYEYDKNAPKTFYIKYTNDRAAQFESAKQALMEGKEVRINGIPSETSPGGESSEGSVNEVLQGIISQYLNKVLPKQGDTYAPKVPDIEIVNQVVPPQKGAN